MNKLVEEADIILIAKAIKVQTNKTHSNELFQPTNTTFQIIETLRGNPLEKVTYGGLFDLNADNDFDHHTKDEFWKYGVGRAERHTSCGPQHSFIEGKTYLIFPNHFNASKSAEVLNSENDRWLLYVKERL